MGNILSARKERKRRKKRTADLHIRNNVSRNEEKTFQPSRCLTPEQEKRYDTQDRTLTFVDGVDDFDCQRKDVRSRYEEETSSGSQINRSLTPEQEKRYDPRDRTLTFVDGEDDLDFLCDNFKSLRAKMSCGHAVTPMSLTNWCRRLLDEGKCRFVCGKPDCDVEWPYEEVFKMALLTKDERQYFEKKLFSNAANDYLGVKKCPSCKSRVVRADLSDLSVECTACTAAKKRPYMFCWQCLREWKGPAPRSDRCENKGCINEPLGTLRNCPEIVFESVQGVTGCPSIRACPTCGLLAEHDKTKCKHITCPRCKVKFCFVCLKISEECLKSSDYYSACSTGVAPRQTCLPVWERG